MRYALHSTLRPGQIDGYIREHARIPDDLREVFDRVGIGEWVIWRSGDRLFHLVECDDLPTALAAVEAEPANDRWQARIGAFVAEFFDAEGNHTGTPLQEVWSLSEQRRADLRPHGSQHQAPDQTDSQTRSTDSVSKV